MTVNHYPNKLPILILAVEMRECFTANKPVIYMWSFLNTITFNGTYEVEIKSNDRHVISIISDWRSACNSSSHSVCATLPDKTTDCYQPR